jgi:hypothetical protein
MVDEIAEDNELFTAGVAIYPEFFGQLGNTIREVSGGGGGSIEGDVGPAVRFTVPEVFEPNGVCLDALRPDYMGNPITPIWVYVKGAGPDDTTWGEDLIEPFLVEEPDTLSERIFIDLTERPDYENLCGMTGDFWVHFLMTDETNFSFVQRDWDKDNCLDDHEGRDWLNYKGQMVRQDNCYDILLRINWAPPGCIGIRGDANGDGATDVLDVLAIVNHILGDPLTGDAACRGDCNGDGAIDVLDALGVVNVILGTGECLPGACKVELTSEAMEVLKSLQSYLSAEDYARFMALVKGEVGVPAEYRLAQNYPNPFNPVTSIEYSVAGHVRATLKVYNVLGQEVVTLVDEVKEPGQYSLSWDAGDMASGVYFYRLDAGEYSATRRMVLMK